jgi:hypothetical protein
VLTRARLFRALGAVGIVLLGGALALAPIYAFQDRMTIVSGLGIAGIACLLVAWLLKRSAAESEHDREN